MRRVLILCTGNSCRSQMAEGYFRFYAPEDVEIYSAGIETHGVNKKAIEVMKEDGVDISSHTSNNVNEYMHLDFDFIITVCDHAQEKCPYIPSRAKRLHFNFPDPAKALGTNLEILNQFRITRDMIKDYAIDFMRTQL